MKKVSSLTNSMHLSSSAMEMMTALLNDKNPWTLMGPLAPLGKTLTTIPTVIPTALTNKMRKQKNRMTTACLLVLHKSKHHHTVVAVKHVDLRWIQILIQI
jgi:hypothetical protein